jgi:hypothetical protein
VNSVCYAVLGDYIVSIEKNGRQPRGEAETDNRAGRLLVPEPISANDTSANYRSVRWLIGRIGQLAHSALIAECAS